MMSAIVKRRFGRLPDGRAASLYTLSNAAGMTVAVTDYGAIITAVNVPDRDGVYGDVVLGFDTLEPYLGTHPYFGALVGRYANRIAGGRFVLDGKTVQLDVNDPPNHLHGGSRGFDRHLWQADVEGATLVLRRVSPHGEMGYPGVLTAEVRYRLMEQENVLSMVCSAATTAPTPVNLTQHSYFNLAGQGDILGHRLQIAAQAFTPIDAHSIPLGAHAPVAGTPFDFRAARAIGERIADTDPQLLVAGGYDHNFVLDGGTGPAAVLQEPHSGRVLELWTDQPGVQFYSGNYLDGSLHGKGRTYPWRGGLCLEPQHFPNSPNVAAFPSTILRPGQHYRHESRYRFSTI
ncbi:MAG: galactose mutarotase [Massilia sp.]|nr:galactose mutarotase [Massilia sp.]